MKLSNIESFEHIPDFLNSFVVFFIFYYFISRFKINKIFLIYLTILLISPFLINDFLISWTMFPDQSKYAQAVYLFRNFEYKILIEQKIISLENQYFSVNLASFILSLFPVPFITTIKSIGIINRGIISALILYFVIKKACPSFFIYLLLFTPSIVFYSSLALRETLILCISLLYFYFFFKKKYIYSILYMSIIFMLKYSLGLIYFLTSILYYIFFIANIRRITKLITILFITTLFFFYQEAILLKIYNYRLGFIEEEFSNSILPVIILESSNRHSFLYFFLDLISGTRNFFLSPIINSKNIYSSLLFFEYICIYLIILFTIVTLYKIDKLKIFFWIVVLFFFSSLIGFVILNDGTLWRFKIQYLILVLFCMWVSIKKN
jgi:hypothetical protein